MTSSRDPWLDNAKMALVTLVVVGHLWAMLPADSFGHDLYVFLYLWHMPAFIFVTGYLSRRFTWTPSKLWSLVCTLAVPYVIFEAALALFRTHVGGESLVDIYTDPHFPYWYLPAVLIWRLLTPIFRPLWGGVVVAVAVSLVSGFMNDGTAQFLDLARILGFLPFFVLGLKTTPERLAMLRTRSAGWLGAAAFGLVAILALNLDRWTDLKFLYYKPYDMVEGADTTMVLSRLLVIGVGMVAALAFLSLTPRIGGWFAAMGSATMIVYVFHGFAVKGLDYAGFGDWTQDHPWTGLLAATGLGLLIAGLLAARPIRRRLEPVVDPIGSAERTVDRALELTAVVEQQDQHQQQTRSRELVSR
ncbi:MAG: acyltransferase family protein [Nocardioidaceae bacterium]|nr:acyltransferase family protein [Nocardioidaceae bacterium]